MSNRNSRKRPGGDDGAGLTLKEAAALGGVTPATLRRWHSGGGLEFERIAEVRLKGFTASTEIFVARARPDTP